MTEARRVAYLLSVVPQRSPFTEDEVVALDEVRPVLKLAVIGRSWGGWSPAPPIWSPRLWLAVVRQLKRRPGSLLGAILALARPALTRPHDLAVGLRAALAACYLARHRVDLIHAQFAGPAAAAAFVWGRLSGTPFTVRVHAYDIYTPYRWAGAVLRKSARVVAISRDGAGVVHDSWQIPADIIQVGVPADLIPERPAGLPRAPFRLVSVGALDTKKGHDVAITAVQRLLRDGVDLAFDIIGDGPRRAELQRQAEPTPQIRFCGYRSVDDVRQSLKHYDALLAASRVTRAGDRDGIPVVLMEAMAARVPVVATSVGGIPELVVDRVTGTLVAPQVESIESAIRSLQRDYLAALAMTDAAHERIRATFDVMANARRLSELWDEILGTRPQLEFDETNAVA